MPKARVPVGDFLADPAEADYAEVLPRISAPVSRFLSQTPRFIAASAAPIDRDSASISAHACSATEMLFAPGAFMPTMPRSVAAVTSTLSTRGSGAGNHPKPGSGGDQLRVDLGGLRTNQGVRRR